MFIYPFINHIWEKLEDRIFFCLQCNKIGWPEYEDEQCEEIEEKLYDGC